MIIKKLKTIQIDLKAPKNQVNNFGHYNYRSCEDILEAVKPLLARLEMALTISDEIVSIGNENYVKATATIYLDEEKLEVSAYAKEPKIQKGMSESQITGSTSSYARKYALNGLFAIDDTKDADTQDNSQPEPIRKAVELPNQVKAQLSSMGSEVCKKCGAKIVVNPKTGKSFCEAKCWLNTQQSEDIIDQIPF